MLWFPRLMAMIQRAPGEVFFLCVFFFFGGEAAISAVTPESARVFVVKHMQCFGLGTRQPTSPKLFGKIPVEASIGHHF